MKERMTRMRVVFRKFFTILGSAVLALIPLTFFSTMQIANWPWLNYWGIRGPRSFIDLDSVLSSADCYKRIGFEIYSFQIGEPCSYIYGSWLIRVMHTLQLGIAQKTMLGWIGIIGVSIVFGYVISQCRKQLVSLLICMLVIISPPITLLLERGNIDILIVFLLIAGAVLVSRKATFLGFIFIFFATLVKFYPIVILIFLVLTLKGIKPRMRLFGASLSVLAVIQIYFDYRRGPGFVKTEWTSFGSPVFGLYLKHLNFDVSYLESVGLGTLWLLAGILVLLAIERVIPRFKDLASSTHLNSTTMETLFLHFIVVHTGCYVIGMSFDYRLIFLVLANLILILKSRLSYQVRNTLAISTLVILWTSVNLQILQPLGDLLIGFYTCLYLLLLFRVFQNSRAGIFGRVFSK